MADVTLEKIKELRKHSKAGVMDCRCALEECKGDIDEAKKWLLARGLLKAAKRVGREAKEGFIEAYSHNDGKIVAVVELFAETDFVAKNEDFRKLAHEIAMQVAAMNPKTTEELLCQPYIRDEKRTIDSLVKELAGTVGENIAIGRIARFSLGQE